MRQIKRQIRNSDTPEALEVIRLSVKSKRLNYTQIELSIIGKWLITRIDQLARKAVTEREYQDYMFHVER